MKKNLLYVLAAVLMLSIFAGCRKDAFEGTPANNKGGTFVRFINKTAKAPINEFYFTPFTDVKDIQVFDLRRDAYSNASLNTPVTVTLEYDAAALTKYNQTNNTTFEMLPEAIYTVNAPGFTKTATGFTVTFAAGETAKPFGIKLDGSKYNLDKKYAFPLKVTKIEGDATLTASATEGSLLPLFAIKNKYDGVYEISGKLTDANALYTGYYPGQPFFDAADPRIYSLATISDDTALFFDLWYPYQNYLVVSSTGGFANTGLRPRIKFNLTTNEVIAVVNDSNGAAFTNVSGKFNPTDRSITLKWTSGRWSVDETFKFIRER